MKHRGLSIVAALLASLAGLVHADSAKPNILLILADDLGYSDLGCYGGEIATPNLDSLARTGLRFTQMANSARCCPSRASLLTGLNPAQAGIPNFNGSLNDQCVTIAEVLPDDAEEIWALVNATFSAAMVPDYAAIVRENWRRREAGTIAQRLQAGVRSGEAGAVDEAIGALLALNATVTECEFTGRQALNLAWQQA